MCLGLSILKPVLQNEITDPTFGSLLVHARDFIGGDGTALESIPARIWATMNNSKVERSLFDRLLAPENTMANEVRIPYDRWSYIVDAFGSHPDTFREGTHQNVCWKKFITCVRKNAMKRDIQSLSLKEILEIEISQEDQAALDALMASHRLTLLP